MNNEKTWDVIVVGGGVTGFTAATAAARNGAKTLLIEKDAALGGTMTNVLVGPMMTFHSAKEQVIKGIAQEVIDRLMAMHASPGHVKDTTGYVETVTPFDHEALKLVAQRMVLESGAQVLLHTWVQDVLLENQTVRGVVVQNKSGTETLYGRVIIDTSGDADVAYRAGAPWEQGRIIDKRVQPVSLMFKAGPVNLPALREYILNHPKDFDMTLEGIQALKEEKYFSVNGFIDQLHEGMSSGELPFHREALLFFSTNYPDEVIVNTSRVTDIDPLNTWELTKAEFQAREQIFALMTFMQKSVPGFEKAHILSAGSRVGVRESRRIMGEYILTAEDVISGKHFPDAVVRNAYPIDIHAPTPEEPSTDKFLKPGEYYEIPYRCLVPQKVEQLLVAGRCISTTHEAIGSTRTSPTCMALGQAAGTAAALSIREETNPRQLETGLLRKTLIAQGVFLE